jgi:hypothetical protein
MKDIDVEDDYVLCIPEKEKELISYVPGYGIIKIVGYVFSYLFGFYNKKKTN